MAKRLTTAKVSNLVNWQENPRFIKDERYAELKQSIQELGFNDVLKLAADGKTVIGGNMRLKALKELGIEEVDVFITTAKTPEQIFKTAMRDNEAFGEYERDQLVELAYKLQIPEIELETYMVHLGKPQSIADLVAQDTQEIVEDDPPQVEESKPAKSVLGTVYQLGRHRVGCMDSTKTEDVNLLMKGKTARMVFTDPPWNVDYGSNVSKKSNPWRKEPRKIENDNLGVDFIPWLMEVIDQLQRVSDKGCPTYVVMSAQEWGGIMQVMENAGYHWSSTIIWNKDQLVFSRKDYHTKYEPIWYGWLDGESRLVQLKDRKQTDVWDIDRPNLSEHHPTTKPIELVARAVNNSSKSNDIILDLFLGSGSTLIACEQTDRTCYGMEISEQYCDVVRRRYHKFVTGSEEGWEDATPPVN